MTLSAAGPSGAATFAYDGIGRLTGRTDAAGSYGYTYTARSQPATESDPITGSRTYTYNPSGEVAAVALGATLRTYSYDGIGRLANETLVNNGNSAVIESTVYAYDQAGNETNQTYNLAGNPATGQHTYTYDLADRLTSWTGPGQPAVNYSYDAAGNRTQGGAQAFTYDERNQQLTGTDGTNTWTPRGTLATTTKNAVTTNYTFDGLGRMTAVGAAAYTYDGLDRVHQRIENATTATFTYAGAETDPTGDGTNTYSRQGGRLLGVRNGATNLAAAANTHGDITHLYNPATATVSGTKIFDPFGVPAGTTGTTPNRIGYQSDWTDPTPNQIWMGARWYSPANDTFTSRDTSTGQLRNPVSLNLYTYAANNPTKYGDPTGHCVFNVNGDMVEYPDTDPVCAGAVPVISTYLHIRSRRPARVVDRIRPTGGELHLRRGRQPHPSRSPGVHLR